MAEAARVFGQGGTVEHKGTSYRLSPLTLDMLALYEVWLEDRAWKRVERTRGRVTASVYQERYDAMTRLVASNAFAFNGPIAQDVSRTAEGTRYLLYLMLSVNEGMSEALAAEIYDADVAALEARMNQLNSDPDPNAQTPVTA